MVPNRFNTVDRLGKVGHSHSHACANGQVHACSCTCVYAQRSGRALAWVCAHSCACTKGRGTQGHSCACVNGHACTHMGVCTLACMHEGREHSGALAHMHKGVEVLVQVHVPLGACTKGLRGWSVCGMSGRSASVAQSAPGHGSAQECRPGVGDPCPRSVSYTHLTLPTKA